MRGRTGFIERAVFEVPAAEKLTVSDLRIGGEPIRFGGQLAEHVTVKLVGLAAVGAGFHNRPAGLPYRAWIDPANPSMVGSMSVDEAFPPGMTPAFDYPEAITSARIVERREPPVGKPAAPSLDAGVMTTETTPKAPMAPIEPVLDVDEIQGNALPGFMKPHMVLAALAIADAGPARRWLRRARAPGDDPCPGDGIAAARPRGAHAATDRCPRRRDPAGRRRRVAEPRVQLRRPPTTRGRA